MMRGFLEQELACELLLLESQPDQLGGIHDPVDGEMARGIHVQSRETRMHARM